MKITMKRRDLIQLDQVLSGLSRIQETRFAYVVARNKRFIRDDIGALEEARQAPKGYEEYERRRIKLIRKHVAKDAEGNPIMFPNGNTRLQTEDEFEQEFNDLKDEFKEVLEQTEKKEKELQELLDSEQEIECYTIKVKYLPKDLNPSEMDALIPLIDGDMEELFDESE